MGVVEVATPVGEDNGQGAGDEGDDPQPRLGVAAVQQAEQGGKQQQTEEDVNVPEKSKKLIQDAKEDVIKIYLFIHVDLRTSMVYIDTSLSLCCKTSFTFAAAAQYLLCVPTHTIGRSPTPLISI